MRLRAKFIAHMLLFAIIIIVLVQPQILIAIQNTTPKEAYPNGSLVITMPAQATEQDLRYCYLGISDISISVVFYNVPEGNTSWMNPTIEQLARADINISISGYHWENASAQSYYDLEFEQKIDVFRDNDGADIVVSFTNLYPQPADLYGHLAGYSRVQNHLSVIFMENLNGHTEWASFVALHEITHNLGYFPSPNGHSQNAASIMYAVYSGTNNAFDATDLALLESQH